MGSERTSIQVSHELWRELKDRKESPGESYEDVIWDLLEESEPVQGE